MTGHHNIIMPLIFQTAVEVYTAKISYQLGMAPCSSSRNKFSARFVGYNWLFLQLIFSDLGGNAYPLSFMLLKVGH